jgi:hypothetical protein
MVTLTSSGKRSTARPASDDRRQADSLLLPRPSLTLMLLTWMYVAMLLLLFYRASPAGEIPAYPIPCELLHGPTGALPGSSPPDC